MLGKPYYHGITRKIIVAFGQLFSNIKIQRFNTSNVVEQLIDVPVSYGNKEKWYRRLQEEPEIDKRVAITLPRIGFEVTGMEYDSSRRLNKLTQYKACNPTLAGNFLSAFAPVPYVLLKVFIPDIECVTALVVVNETLLYTIPKVPAEPLTIVVPPPVKIIVDDPALKDKFVVIVKFIGAVLVNVTVLLPKLIVLPFESFINNCVAVMLKFALLTIPIFLK